MSTTNLPPTGPDPAARTRAFPYLQAGAYAVLLGLLLWHVTRDWAFALQLPAGLFVVLAVQPHAHHVTRRLFGNRIDPAWIGMAGPIAGTIASYGALGLFVATGHVPLLAIALIGVCFTANATLRLTPPAPMSGELQILLAFVCLGGALAALGSPWGPGVVPVVIGQLMIELRSVARNRRKAQASRNADTQASFRVCAALWCFLIVGLALCLTAFALVV